MHLHKTKNAEKQLGLRYSDKPFLAIFVSVVLWFFFLAYHFLFIRFLYQGNVFETLKILFSSPSDFLLWVSLLLVFLLLAFIYMKKSKQINDFLYKWRWPIAGLILTLLVVFEISGSSLAMWGKTLPGGTTEGLLLGTPRALRTDEWATSLPMTFAQFNDVSGYLPYYGEVFRATGTDMYLVSNQPVLDIATLFKPLNWGYLLFGMAKGLSFSWSCRLVALVLLTFEIGMLLFQKSKPLSLAFAIFIAFSPVLSWWGSGDLVLYGEALLLLFIAFFKTERRGKKTLIAVAFFIMMGAYTLVCYPAWQVPYAFLFLIIGTTYLVSIRKSFTFSAKKDLVCIVPGLAIFIIGMLYVWSMSSETIYATMNTSYPGQRSESGGNAFDAFFKYPLTLFTPLTNAGLSVDRIDSISTYFDFFPLGIMLGCYVLFIQRKRNPLLIAFLLFEVFLMIYCTIGFPEWLARLTLMSFSIPKRVVVVASFMNIFLLFYCISIMDEQKRKSIVIWFSIAYACVMVFVTWIFEPGFVTVFKAVILVLLLSGSVIAFLLKSTRWILACSLTIALFAGALVNPIQSGIAPVQDNVLIQQVRDLKNTSDKKWISATDWAENVTALGGASTINTTQFYPNLELWEILDPDGSEIYTYNRFAHLNFTIKDIPEATIVLQPGTRDVVHVEVPVQQLQQLDTGYILSWKELDSLNGNKYGVRFMLIDKYEGYHLYEIEYS